MAMVKDKIVFCLKSGDCYYINPVAKKIRKEFFELPGSAKFKPRAIYSNDRFIFV
jgi:hypothetical protein